MDQTSTIESRLLDYIDGRCSSAEAAELEQLMAGKPEWAQKHAELLQLHQLLQSNLEVMEPSMRFTKNVMEEVAKYKIAPATRSYLNKKFVYAIGGFFALVLVGILVYAFSSVDWGTGSGESSFSLPMPAAASGIDWSGLSSSTLMTAFMMLNAVLGLVLLDRYFSNKRKQRMA